MTDYRLVFEGPDDSSQETLRKLKGVFITELECSVEQVIEYLSETPSVVYSSDDHDDIERMKAILANSGAIVRLEGETPTEDFSEEEDISEGEDAIEFSFDLDELEEEPISQEPKELKVYSLDFNPEEDDIDESLEEILNPIEDSPAASSQEAPVLDLSFDDENDEEQSDETDLSSLFTEEETEKATADTDSTDGTPEFDLSLSFDDEPLEELKDDPAFDLNVAGNGQNWDLAFDEGEPELATNAATKETIAEEALTPATDETIAEEPAGEVTHVALDFETTEETQEILEEELTEEAPLMDTVSIESQGEPIIASVNSISDFSEESKAEIPVVHVDEHTSQTNPEDQPQSDAIVQEAEYHSETEHAADLAAAPSTQKKKFAMENLPLLGVFLGLLFIGNAYFFWNNFLSSPSGGTGLSQENLQHMIATAAKRSKEPVKASPVETKPTLPKMRLTGKQKMAEGVVTWDLTSQGDQILTGSLVFSAPKPKSLSKLEIARGAPKPPWIHKAELNKITFTHAEDGQSMSSSPVRIFIQQGDTRTRIVGIGTVILAYNAQEDLIAGTLLMTPSDAEATGKTHFSITGDSTNGFEYSLETEWVSSGGAKKIKEEK